MQVLSTPTIPKKDLKVIKKQRHEHPSKKIRCRLNVLWLTTVCKTASEIALIAGTSIRSVFSYIRMYSEGGLQKLMEVNFYSPKSKLEAYSGIIISEFKANPPSSIREAKHRIKQLTGLKRSETQVRKFLKNLGMKLLKPGAIPMGKNEKNIEDKVRSQKTFVAEKLEPTLKSSKEGEHTVLFMDACHIQLACMLGFIWCFVKQYIRALPLKGRINIIGACSPYGADFVYDATQDKIDQYAIVMFLAKVRNRIKNGKITIVLDNAKYHTTSYVRESAEKLGIELLFLPVASPNLNIIERIWKFVKKTFVINTVFESLDNLEQHLKRSLSSLKSKYKKNLQSLLTLNFQHFDGTAQFVAA